MHGRARIGKIWIVVAPSLLRAVVFGGISRRQLDRSLVNLLTCDPVTRNRSAGHLPREIQPLLQQNYRGILVERFDINTQFRRVSGRA
jgi:hypothetical protein